MGLILVNGSAVADGNLVTKLLIAVDGVPYGTAIYGLPQSDFCSTGDFYPSCFSGGWSFTLNTNLLPNGKHTLTATALSSGGNATTSTAFTVANWAEGNPMRITIDTPGDGSGPLSGVTPIGGWVIADNAAITSVSVSVDGVPMGSAYYGGMRNDVCAAYPMRAGCPNVGWNFALNTTLLANGAHTLQITANSSAGETSNVTRQFSVTGNPMHFAIDAPGAAHSGAFSGMATFVGWLVHDDESIAHV